MNTTYDVFVDGLCLAKELATMDEARAEIEKYIDCEKISELPIEFEIRYTGHTGMIEGLRIDLERQHY